MHVIWKIYNLQRNTAVGTHLGLYTRSLAGGELGHTAVIRVIHKVVCTEINFLSITISRDLRIGSTPPPEQVSLLVGQPEAGEASGGVSDTESPEPEHPPWKVYKQ